MGSLMYLIGGLLGNLIATYLGAPLWAGLLAFMAGGISFQLVDIEQKLNGGK